MDPTFRERYTTVAATLALAVALGATGAYAAGTITANDIAKDAVTSRAVRNETLTAADLRDGAVSTGKVKDGSLRRRDLGPGALLTASVGSLGVMADPPATPSSCCFGPSSITLSRPTRVLVLMRVDQTFSCPAVACSFQFGAYLRSDGGAPQGVAGTGDVGGAGAGGTATKSTTSFSVVDLPAGTHTVAYGTTRTGSSGSTSLGRVQVLLLELGNTPGSPTGDPDGRGGRPVVVR